MTEQHVMRMLFDWRSAVASRMGPESPVTRHLLLTLSLYMSPKGDSCFPSVRRLAEETALSRSTVMKHLDVAHQTDWIVKIERPMRSGQGWRRMEYVANIPKSLETRIKAYLDEGGLADGPPLEGGRPGDEGGPPDSEKVVRQVDLKSSVNSSKSNPIAQRFAPPSWIPPESWQGFETMRAKIRKPMTERAKGMIVTELEKLKAQGHDPVAVLAQSEINSWAGVYPIKSAAGTNGGNGVNKQLQLEARNAEVVRRLTERAVSHENK